MCPRCSGIESEVSGTTAYHTDDAITQARQIRRSMPSVIVN